MSDPHVGAWIRVRGPWLPRDDAQIRVDAQVPVPRRDVLLSEARWTALTLALPALYVFQDRLDEMLRSQV
ncbi:MAG: hypothetical protein AAFV53_41930 [Myxococcota bacterium]